MTDADRQRVLLCLCVLVVVLAVLLIPHPSRRAAHVLPAVPVQAGAGVYTHGRVPGCASSSGGIRHATPAFEQPVLADRLNRLARLVQRGDPSAERDAASVLHRLRDELEAGRTTAAALATVFGQTPNPAVDHDTHDLEAWFSLRLSALCPSETQEDRRLLAGRLALAVGVCGQSGAPLVPLLDALIATDAHQRTVAGRKRRALAVPQTTIRLLTALPAVLLIGGSLLADPVGFLLTPMGLVCLAVGIGLIVCGVLWYRRVIRDYERKER
jgi:hypothetical protein